ncbi:hypothetical protein [Microcoleus sp. AT3-D2]|uniref:hypothetical protein n=1 Tax=Microcoleus sp. AT3-D2 TaxID=2818612 RepID=UPI002FD55990
MALNLRVAKVCGFNGSDGYSDYNRNSHCRSIHLIYVQTTDNLWAYRSLCHLDEQHKICIENQMSDDEVSVIQKWLIEN